MTNFSAPLPGQLPTNVTKKSYQHVIAHGITEQGVFACKTTGARILARMTKMRIYDRLTGSMTNYAPVCTLYCASCDKVPKTRGGDKIFEDMIQTVSL